MSDLIKLMTWIDISIMMMVVISMWRGFSAGFIKTAVSLVSWLFAFIVASRMTKLVAPMLVGIIDDSVLQMATAFLAIVFVVMMAMQLITLSLSGLFKVLKLGFLDRILGGILGAVIGVLKVLIILSIMSLLFLLTYLPNWQSSILAQNLLPFAPVAMQLLQEVLGETWQQINNP